HHHHHHLLLLFLLRPRPPLVRVRVYPLATNPISLGNVFSSSCPTRILCCGRCCGNCGEVSCIPVLFCTGDGRRRLAADPFRVVGRKMAEAGRAATPRSGLRRRWEAIAIVVVVVVGSSQFLVRKLGG